MKNGYAALNTREKRIFLEKHVVHTNVVTTNKCQGVCRATKNESGTPIIKTSRPSLGTSTYILVPPPWQFHTLLTSRSLRWYCSVKLLDVTTYIISLHLVSEL